MEGGGVASDCADGVDDVEENVSESVVVRNLFDNMISNDVQADGFGVAAFA